MKSFYANISPDKFVYSPLLLPVESFSFKLYERISVLHNSNKNIMLRKVMRPTSITNNKKFDTEWSFNITNNNKFIAFKESQKFQCRETMMEAIKEFKQNEPTQEISDIFSTTNILSTYQIVSAKNGINSLPLIKGKAGRWWLFPENKILEEFFYQHNYSSIFSYCPSKKPLTRQQVFNFLYAIVASQLEELYSQKEYEKYLNVENLQTDEQENIKKNLWWIDLLDPSIDLREIF